MLLDTLCTPWWNLCSWNVAGCVGRFLIRFMAAGAGAESSSSSSFKYWKSENLHDPFKDAVVGKSLVELCREEQMEEKAVK